MSAAAFLQYIKQKITKNIFIFYVHLIFINIYIYMYIYIRIRRKNKNKIKIVLRLSVCVHDYTAARYCIVRTCLRLNSN